ncbi:MAG: BMP family protein [Candidatus Promineifilaceae bacterium]
MKRRLILLFTFLFMMGMLVACGGEVEEPHGNGEATSHDDAEHSAENSSEGDEVMASDADGDEAMASDADGDEAMASDADGDEAMASDEVMVAGSIEPIRIAVVMPSAITDLAWSQSVYDALIRIQEESGADVVEIAYTEGMFNVTDAAAALRDYAADGYNLIIAHGTQYGSSLFEIAPDFPDTSFAYGTAVDFGADAGLENVFAYEARAEEGGYVNGVMAASLSESGVIGVVGPVEAGDAKLYIDGFVAGAKATNPDVVVNVSYTGSFGDTALAAEAANVHIDAGADVLTGSAQQVVGAINVAKEAGVPWMGTQSDQSPLAPDIVVSSQLYDWEPTLRDMIAKHQSGNMGGTAYKLTLDNGGLVMDYKDGLDADAVQAGETAGAGVASGAIDAFSAAAVVVSEESMAMEEDAMMVDIDPIRIAIVMPSATTDLAWSQSIFDSLLRIQDAAGGEAVVEIAFTEGMFNVTDAAAALRDYAADGFNLVIAHGTQYGSSLFEIAPDFPETSFAYGTAIDFGADAGLENVFAYEARAEEGGYVNGVLAASLSEAGVIGVVGPVEAGDAKLYIDGFVQGATATNSDVVVNISYTGSFGDTALAAEAANVHIGAGADILTGSAQQVVGAIGVASEAGVPWMGTQSDQSPLAPEIVVATQLYDWDTIMLDIITKHQAGEYGGTAYKLTLENGGLTMVYQGGLDADAVAAAEAAEAGIAAGDITVTIK